MAEVDGTEIFRENVHDSLETAPIKPILVHA